MNTIGIIIKLLDEKNISQRDLANTVGFSEQKFTDWKAGRTNSYLKYLPKIAEYFNVSVDYLLGNEQKEKLDTNKDIERIMFYEKFNNLSSDAQKVIRAQIEFYEAQEKENPSKR